MTYQFFYENILNYFNSKEEIINKNIIHVDLKFYPLRGTAYAS